MQSYNKIEKRQIIDTFLKCINTTQKTVLVQEAHKNGL